MPPSVLQWNLPSLYGITLHKILRCAWSLFLIQVCHNCSSIFTDISALSSSFCCGCDVLDSREFWKHSQQPLLYRTLPEIVMSHHYVSPCLTIMSHHHVSPSHPIITFHHYISPSRLTITSRHHISPFSMCMSHAKVNWLHMHVLRSRYMVFKCIFPGAAYTTVLPANTSQPLPLAFLFSCLWFRPAGNEMLTYTNSPISCQSMKLEKGGVKSTSLVSDSLLDSAQSFRCVKLYIN